MNDIDSGTECTFSMFTDDTKLRGAVNVLQGWDAVQRDQDRLEQLAQVNLMMLNKSTCKICTWVVANPTISIA